MFGRLKDSHRIATCYDRCPEACLSAIALERRNPEVTRREEVIGINPNDKAIIRVVGADVDQRRMDGCTALHVAC